MTEINTNAQANRLPGLASGLNTTKTIESLLNIERRRLAPVQARRDETQVELDAFENVKEVFNTWNETVKTLSSNAIWEGKLVESSNEDVVTATATAGAQPGKHTLVVDRLALNHQISSQGYEAVDTPIGRGRFSITVGEANPVTIAVDESNDSLQGLRDAINSSNAEVNATIIRTGEKLRPHQMVLTSQKTGSIGRIVLDIDLRAGEAPNFSNAFDQPTDWAGVGELVVVAPPPTGTGASNAIIRVIGTFTGDDDKTFTFTAVQTGTVGGEDPLQLRWKADTGEQGVIELDSFNYSPGEPIEFVDGLSLIVSEGDILVSDSFDFRARAEKSSLFWWLSDEDRASGVSQPSRWQRQQEAFGAPVIEGTYLGEEDRQFTLTVEGSGQVGAGRDLTIRWQTDDGETGFLRVGRGYKPGSKLALLDGLTISVNPGVLGDGDTSTFSVTAEELSSRWWLDEAERRIPAEIGSATNWEGREVEDEEEGFVTAPEFPEDLGPRISSTAVTVAGEYEGDEPKVYTFTAQRDGTIGTTKALRIRWVDDKENSGEIEVGDIYTVGTPIPFDSGLTIAFDAGRVFNEDTFTLRTRTSTIQPPQDALIRLGATEFGGGLEITNSTNDLDGVIEGVKLRLVSPSEVPVTVTIKGDTERALETLLAFAEQYNQFAILTNELTQFDQDNNISGPLLGDRQIANFRDTLSGLLINPVPGLPQNANMIFTLGLKLDNEGLLEIDEDVLRNKIQDDFGAVADLFRTRGSSENSGVSVVAIGEETKISPTGYSVDITQVPTRAEYLSPPIGQPIVITEQNNRFFITVDGRQSESISIDPGTYSLPDYVRAIQDAVTNDENIGQRRVRVSAEDNQLRVSTGILGSRGGIEFAPPGTRAEAPPGLMGGQVTDGVDTAGTINNEPAEGLGQILRGSDESDNVKGLRLFVTLNESQLNPNGPEASIKVTKGVASRVAAYLARIVDPLRGEMKRITDGLRGQIRSFDTQLESMNERIERKRKSLQIKFARLESQLVTMRSQQAAVAAQGGASAAVGLPGLPGLRG